MPVPTPDYRLYLVLDPKLCAQTGIVQTALAAAQAGAGIIQLRAPYWKKRELYECAIELKTALAPFKIPLIIDDHVDVAVASGADGVHQIFFGYAFIDNIAHALAACFRCEGKAAFAHSLYLFGKVDGKAVDAQGRQ